MNIFRVVFFDSRFLDYPDQKSKQKNQATKTCLEMDITKDSKPSWTCCLFNNHWSAMDTNEKGKGCMIARWVNLITQKYTWCTIYLSVLTTHRTALSECLCVCWSRTVHCPPAIWRTLFFVEKLGFSNAWFGTPYFHKYKHPISDGWNHKIEQPKKRVMCDPKRIFKCGRESNSRRWTNLYRLWLVYNKIWAWKGSLVCLTVKRYWKLLLFFLFLTKNKKEVSVCSISKRSLLWP
jgi:hypothetical protein